MKWLVAVLVLLNVGIFLWASGPRELFRESDQLADAPVNPRSMRLLSEAVQIRRTAAATTPPASPGLCLRIGPFEDRLDADQAKLELDALGAVVTRRTDPPRKIQAHRVYVGPFKSEAELSEGLARVRRLGVDHYVVPDREGWELVSLGLFSSAASAERHLGDLASRGLPAQRRAELRLLPPNHWFEMSGVDGEGPLHARLLATRWPGALARARAVACNGLADAS